ncbi:MAG: hypothetical protein LBQ40_04860, partial [Clostridiales bacterium]|nr:hypothetical protein [Clostridiales bacterium]
MKREKDKDTHVIISEVSRKKLKDKKLLISSLAANFAVSAVFSLLYSPMARGGFMTLETLPEAASIFVMLLLVFFLLYSYEKYVTKTLAELKSYLILIVSAFIVLTASIFLQRHVSEFFIPLVFLFLTCAALLNEKSAMYTLFLVSFALLFIILNGGAALIDDDGYSIVKTREVYGVLFNTLCGAVMIFTYKRNYKRINIVLLNTVFGIFITGFAVVYGAITGEFDPLNSLWTTVSVVSSTAAFMLLLPIFERVFNVATDVRLSEYLLLKNPVLKELKEKAPGTYNHSLMVGTLAESCA